MDAAEIRVEILQWHARLLTLKLKPLTRYSQASGSAYINVPLKLGKAAYPVELLGDLQSIGIILLGACNATLDGEPATMGLVGNLLTAGVPPGAQAQAPVPSQSYPAPIADPTAPVSAAVPDPDSAVIISSQNITSITYSPVYMLTQNWSNRAGPARTRAAIPTALAIMRTLEWVMRPSEYRTTFPEDASMGAAPSYINL